MRLGARAPPKSAVMARKGSQSRWRWCGTLIDVDGRDTHMYTFELVQLVEVAAGQEGDPLGGVSPEERWGRRGGLR